MWCVNLLYPDVPGLQHDPHPPLHRLRRQDAQHPRKGGFQKENTTFRIVFATQKATV
jgi:hypothetical protein